MVHEHYVHPVQFEMGDTLDPESKEKFRSIVCMIFNDPVQTALSNTEELSEEVSRLHSVCLNRVNSLFMNIQNSLKMAQFEKNTKTLLSGLGFSIEPGQEVEKLLEMLASQAEARRGRKTEADHVEQVVEALKNKYEVIPKDWSSRYELRDGRIATPDRKRNLMAKDMLMSPGAKKGERKNYFKVSDPEQSDQETTKKEGPGRRGSRFEEDTENKRRKHESKSQQPRKIASAEDERGSRSDDEDSKNTLLNLDKIGERLDNLALRMRPRKKSQEEEEEEEEVNITFQQEDPDAPDGNEGKKDESILEGESAKEGTAGASQENEKRQLNFESPDKKERNELQEQKGFIDEEDEEESSLRKNLSEAIEQHSPMIHGAQSIIRTTLSRPVEISGFFENLDEFVTCYDKNDFLKEENEEFSPETEKMRLEFEK